MEILVVTSTVYHRGGNISWGNYLVLQSNQDIATRLRSQHESLKEAYFHQSSQMQAAIASIGSLEQALIEESGNIADSIDSLRASFDYHLGLVAGQLKEQNSQLAKIGRTLDSISNAANYPKLTRAAEQREIGFERKKVGWGDKALEAFLLSEADNDTDFVVQLEIGSLYLFGKTADYSVVNIDEAIRHLMNATRFSKDYIGKVPGAAECCAQAFLQASIGEYVLSNELHEKGDLAGSMQLTRTALEYAKNAVEKQPSLDRAHYLVARYAALLNQPEIMEPALVRAIELNMLYAVEIFEDQDFADHRLCLEQLIRRLKADKLAVACESKAALVNLHKELADWGCPQSTQSEVQSLHEIVDAAIISGSYIDLARAVRASQGGLIKRSMGDIAACRKSLDNDRRFLLQGLESSLEQLTVPYRKRIRDENSFKAWKAAAKRGGDCKFDNGVEANRIVEELRSAGGTALEEIERVDSARRSSFDTAIGISRMLAVVLPLGIAYLVATKYTLPAMSGPTYGFSRMTGALVAPCAGVFIGFLVASLVRLFFDHQFKAGEVLVATGVAAVAMPIVFMIVALIVVLIMDISGAAKDSIDTVLWALFTIGVIGAWIPGFATFCGKAVFHRNP